MQNRQSQYWPIPRAIFSVLFTHARFRIIHDAQSRARLMWTWVPMQPANAYVIGIVGSDPAGQRNQQITGANLGWLVLGGLLWALTLLGLVLAFVA